MKNPASKLIACCAIASIGFASQTASAMPGSMVQQPEEAEQNVETLAPKVKPGYTPMAPVRLVDTRKNLGSGRLGPQSETTVSLGSIRAVKALDVAAVSLTVTVVNPSSAGHLTIKPAGIVGLEQQSASMAYSAGGVQSTQLLVSPGTAKRLKMINKGATDVIIDVHGFTPRESDFTPTVLRRVVDTRKGLLRGRLSAGSDKSFTVAGVGNVPKDGVHAVALSVTSVSPADDGYLTIYKADEPKPITSNTSYLRNRTSTTMVLVRPDANGKIKVHTKEDTDLVIDVMGYVPEGSPITVIAPQRRLDTRNDQQLPGPLGKKSTHRIKMTGRSGIPDGAHTLFTTTTAVNPEEDGYFNVASPEVGATGTGEHAYPAKRATTALVPTGLNSGGYVSLYTHAQTHLVLDVVGYVKE